VPSEAVSRVSIVLGHVRVRPRGANKLGKIFRGITQDICKKTLQGLAGVVQSTVLCMYHLSWVLGGARFCFVSVDSQHTSASGDGSRSVCLGGSTTPRSPSRRLQHRHSRLDERRAGGRAGGELSITNTNDMQVRCRQTDTSITVDVVVQHQALYGRGRYIYGMRI
jgi:hypothetical protein